jgi:hypothetical protein
LAAAEIFPDFRDRRSASRLSKAVVAGAQGARQPQDAHVRKVSALRILRALQGFQWLSVQGAQWPVQGAQHSKMITLIAFGVFRADPVISGQDPVIRRT